MPSTIRLRVADTEPGTTYSERLNQVDFRIAKAFKVGNKSRLTGTVSAFNLLNGNAPTSLNTTYGPLWLQPSLLQDGRMVQFSATMSF